jgi:hypothetical protein
MTANMNLKMSPNVSAIGRFVCLFISNFYSNFGSTISTVAPVTKPRDETVYMKRLLTYGG